KLAALEELRSGHLAGAVLEGRDSTPWRRTQFLAIRAELAEGWQPRNGAERQLIDMMALAQAAMFLWQQRLADAPYGLGEQAGAMVDRFSRMFVRLLRALRDLRRYAGPVIVKSAGQVNVGGQQVNVSPAPKAAKAG